MSKSNETFYQRIYHLAAMNKGGPEGRKKALATLKAKNSLAAKVYEQVLRNNPHFLEKKGTDSYNRLKNKTYQKRLKYKSKGKETRLRAFD